MNVGIVGLGRMGLGMGARLARCGHIVYGFDMDQNRQNTAESSGVIWRNSVFQLLDALGEGRVIIISVPAGAAVDSVIDNVLDKLQPGDTIVDSGNSFYRDSIRRASDLAKLSVNLLDVGVSGGVWGLEDGYSLMIGGEKSAYEKCEPLFCDLASEGGYAYVGRSGAGHFAKMIHNGIEYGMMEAYAEGFEILKASDYDFDLAALSHVWNSGSVIRSWLLELAEMAFEESPDLEGIRGWVEDSGEGRWTVVESIEERVPAPVIALSLMMRFRSRQEDSFAGKFLSALREKFGGHTVKKL